MALPESEAHHARDVLRLTPGTTVELFDDNGTTASAVIASVTPQSVTVRVDEIREAALSPGVSLTIVSAIPKGDRAEWMIEKLSEIGVSRFIPLAAARSVVLPEGKNKRERWVRIATEAAKQSRRAGVMRIDELMKVQEAINSVNCHLASDAGSAAARRAGVEGLEDPAFRTTAEPVSVGRGGAFCLSTTPGAKALSDVLLEASVQQLSLFIGPEGGWTGEELRLFSDAGLTAVGLTDTILRVETAAVAAAALVRCMNHSPQPVPSTGVE